MKIAAWRKVSKFKKYPVAEVVIATVVTAVINFPITFMKYPSPSPLYHSTI